MIRLDVPGDFDFRATVASHGWCVLAPFAWDREAATLERPLALSGGRASTVRLAQPGGRGTPLEVRTIAGAGSRAGLSGADRRIVRAFAALDAGALISICGTRPRKTHLEIGHLLVEYRLDRRLHFQN